MTNTVARMQVVEVYGPVTQALLGYAVKDTKADCIITPTYRRIGNAINRAIRENERTKNFKYV